MRSLDLLDLLFPLQPQEVVRQSSSMVRTGYAANLMRPLVPFPLEANLCKTQQDSQQRFSSIQVLIHILSDSRLSLGLGLPISKCGQKEGSSVLFVPDS